MCEPVSCAIAGVLLLCCCCVGVIAMVSLAGMIMPLLGALQEVAMCVNTTVAAPIIEKVMQNETGQCRKWKESGCEQVMEEQMKRDQQHGQHGRRLQYQDHLSDNVLQECNEMSSHCFCDFTAELFKLQDPDLSDSLNNCCRTFTGGVNAGLGDLAQAAAQVCTSIAENLTKGFVEVNSNCTATPPRMPSGKAFGELIGTLDGASVGGPQDLGAMDADGFSQYFSVGKGGVSRHFDRIGEVWRPGRAVLQPLAAVGVAAVLLSAASLVLRRRVRAPWVQTPPPPRDFLAAEIE